ncbi:DHH family phosphoesterase [Methanobacterium sp. SMA-27]|uniref:single-stranded-DNA-specific exonuclease RecJ n=1 Tax=Methanobacterium sp. SMA-27 TaxID=1495336 RepID=UPI00064E4601|nr:DHH family phosphoesterase [Methanobacterium sp. SMA-27]
MIQKQQHSLLNKAEEACNLLRRHLKQDHVVRIISHNDADGISAAGVMCNAIAKEKGKFHVTIVPRLKDEVLSKFFKEKYKLFVFCDMGSANLKGIRRLKGDVIIADHHQTNPETTIPDNIIHVNPHLYGLDGTKDVSGSGVSYLTVRPMEYKNLAGLALVGAFGDMQYKNGFSGVNKMILDDGIESHNIEVRDDLKIANKTHEPLYKALSHTINPAIKGISGDEEGSVTFLEKIGISYRIKFTELGNEEKDILKEELVKINPEIFSSVYSIPTEIPELRNLEDYSNILDACGKNKKQGLGLSICIGDRDKSIKEAQDLVKSYSDDLMHGIEWISKEGSVVQDKIQYIYTEEKRKKRIMGTLSSIGLDLEILDPEKPVLAMSRMDNIIKVSGRTTSKMTEKGVNLGYALENASKSFNGSGGGHNIAAGAVIPYREMDNFLNLVDEIIRTQLNAS